MQKLERIGDNGEFSQIHFFTCIRMAQSDTIRIGNTVLDPIQN